MKIIIGPAAGCDEVHDLAANVDQRNKQWPKYKEQGSNRMLSCVTHSKKKENDHYDCCNRNRFEDEGVCISQQILESM